MKLWRFILIPLLAMFCFSLHAQEIEAKFSKKRILIGEQVTLTLVVKGKTTSDNIVWPSIKDTINAYIEVLDSSVNETNAQKEPVKTYTVTSFDSGYYAIPPFVFLIDSQAVQSNALLLEVHTVETDTTKAFRDIKGIRAETYSFSEKVQSMLDWLLEHWYLPAIVIVFIIALIWYFRRNRKKQAPQKPAVVIPLHEQLILDLESVDKKQLWQNNQVKQYYVEVTDLVRSYIEKRFNVKAHEQTTFQLIRSLKSTGIHSEALELLKNILEAADLVKFAKGNPTHYENTGIMDGAKRFAIITQEKEEVKHD